MGGEALPGAHRAHGRRYLNPPAFLCSESCEEGAGALMASAIACAILVEVLANTHHMFDKIPQMGKVTKSKKGQL